ncbi:hypothetical protein BV25DRAFT_1825856 [Artomyces pyxidatus]|uniref:Uncharacterized protein n=1 Tax=Artomyces pyxidatus TaxID=48021 RepID=A0ACB8T002_9AGAM|nr:hypothetical protein BV25DRAFT_1825856 [Artomyces pyxidatus]
MRDSTGEIPINLKWWQLMDRKPTILPTLPPEIWLRILEAATHVPGLLDVDVEDPFDSPHPSGGTLLDTRDEMKALRASLVTKRHVVRVCKQWNTLATPLLYESIFVGRNSPNVLPGTLCSPREGVAHSPGWYTRRLDLSGHASASTLALLPEIIAHLPQLRIFRVLPSRAFHADYRPVLPDPVVRALAGTPSLQMLKWDKSDHLMLWPSLLETLLEACPALRALVGVNALGADCTSPACDSLAYAHLRVERWAESDLQTTPFRNLRQARLAYSIASRRDFRIREVLGASLASLRTLYADVHDIGLVQPFLDSLHVCTNLRHVIITNCFRWVSQAEFGTLPPYVTHLGLHFHRSQGTDAFYRSVFAFIGQLSGQSLTVVRLLNRRGLEDLRLRHTAEFRKGLESLRLKGFRLEDYQGVALLPKALDG